MREFEDVIERSNGRRGVKRLIEYVGLERAPTRSELEDRFLTLLVQHRLPAAMINRGVEDDLEYEVDAQWPAQKLIVELDSWQFHKTRREFEADRRRDAALTARGWRVLRVTWRRLCDEPGAIAAELRALLTGGAS
ncbi:MAG TPA: DUF559 domain-containing protein [Baekduia sp.]|nr:DUF559 domain-containing protein [Baekduia sp.]